MSRLRGAHISEKRLVLIECVGVWVCRQVGDDVGGTLQKKKKKITRNKTGGHGEVGAVVPVGKRRKKKKKKKEVPEKLPYTTSCELGGSHYV